MLIPPEDSRRITLELLRRYLSDAELSPSSFASEYYEKTKDCHPEAFDEAEDEFVEEFYEKLCMCGTDVTEEEREWGYVEPDELRTWLRSNCPFLSELEP